MINQNDQTITIICDKCQSNRSASIKNSNDVFFAEGWVLNRNAKKYFHLCRKCQTKKQRKARDFVASL